MTYEDIVQNKEILEYYERGNIILDSLGYTDHSTAHAVTATRLRYGPEEKRITLYLTIDENICTMYDYFDIFWYLYIRHL